MQLNQLVILAAGKGRRSGEIGKKRQKCSFLLEKNLRTLEGLFDETIIVIGHMAEDIKKSVKKLKKEKINTKIKYVTQKVQMGQAHAVYKTKKLIHNKFDFCVVNGDIILERKYFEEILATTLESPLTTVSYVKDPWNYGIVSLDEEECIKKVIEKPKRNSKKGKIICDLALKGIYKALSGIYFFNYNSFKFLKKTISSREKVNEFYLVDTFRLMIEEGIKIKTFEILNPKHYTTEKDLKELLEKS